MLKLLIGAIVICTLFLLACAGEGNSASGTTSNVDIQNGKEVYRKYCVLCHGDDGKKAVNGAYDITVSEMTLEDRIALITNGRNLMTPFAGILTEEEIRDVAAYSMKLGQQ